MVNSPVVFCEIIFLAVSIFNATLVAVVIVACFVFNAVCNPFVLAIVKLPSVIVACLVKIFAVLVAILVVWPAVRVCKAVVFGSSMFNLPCRAVISVSFEAISVVWFEVSSSNSVKVVCNPSIISCLLSIKVAIFPIGRLKLVWISKLPFIKRLLLIILPVFYK